MAADSESIQQGTVQQSRWESSRGQIQAGLAAAAAAIGAEMTALTIEVMAPTEEGHGDWTTNLCFRLAQSLKRSPVAIAEQLVANFPETPSVERIEVARPGFINFWVDTPWLALVLGEALHHPSTYGHGPDRGQRVLIEFVSANPTGPLVVVNGRAAAWGDSLARILEYAGYGVEREFYVNDAGVQVLKLGQAMAIRLAELAGHALPAEWPEGVYPGDYVKDLAKTYADAHADWMTKVADDAWAELGEFASERLRLQQAVELERFGIHFDRWFSERALRATGAPEEVVAELEAKGLLYERDGARWFASERFGDQKDYVVVKSDGGFTYIVPDAAYHVDKFRRGYDQLIDLLGPDHHGHLSRMRAIMAGLGYPSEHLHILLMQLVRVVRGGQPVRMSKRGGAFVTLSDLMDEVDIDPARWFFLERSADTPMDFDLDLAELKTQDNPVYYVQYAAARISSILAAYEERFGEDVDARDDRLLASPLEQALVRDVARFPALVLRAAEERAPQMIIRYLTTTASHFHAFYRQHRIMEEEPSVRRARADLSKAVLVVLSRALHLVGVSVPERM